MDKRISWRDLNKRLPEMDEAELESLLDREVVLHKRPEVVRRLHQRLCTRRAARERVVLMERIGA